MSDDDSDENPCKKMRAEENGTADQKSYDHHLGKDKNQIDALFLSSLPAGVCEQTQASLREENDSLRWQLDAYRNEVELLRKEQSKPGRADDDHTHTQTHTHGPEAQIQLLQQSMHNMQQVGF